MSDPRVLRALGAYIGGPLGALAAQRAAEIEAAAEGTGPEDYDVLKHANRQLQSENRELSLQNEELRTMLAEAYRELGR